MKFLKILVGVLILFIAGLIGYSIKHLPIIDLSGGLRLYEILHITMIGLVGLLIPFFVKRWIDNTKSMKYFLVDELKETLIEIKEIKEKFHSCYNKKTITAGDKHNINVLFEYADLKLQCMEEQCRGCFPKMVAQLSSDIQTNYLQYWKLITCAELMAIKYKKIDDKMFSRHNELYMSIEKEIKKSINTVIKL